MSLPLARLAKQGETPSAWPSNWPSICEQAEFRRKSQPKNPYYIRTTETSMTPSAIEKRLYRSKVYLGMTKEKRREHMKAWRKAHDETMRGNLDNN